MELVLSPGRFGGGDKSGSPFQNQEVREWSHVDRLTGMLEHARIETGRWQTRHQGSAQVYGKVIDSRERNSADGNVVQKARRQVEVFQSHGAGGRSVQVFRASQWSSSRITDSTSSSPISVSTNEAPSAVRNGAEISSRVQQCSDDQSLAKLSQVSRLCRQMNAETYSSSRLNGRRIKSSVSNEPPSSLLSNNRSPAFALSSITRKSEDAVPNGDRLVPISLQASNGSGGLGKRSSSNEDLTKLLEEGSAAGAKFARDCRARRSLQTQKTSERTRDEEPTSHAEKKANETSKVRTYVLGMREEDSDSDSDSGLDLELAALNGVATAEDNAATASAQCEYLRPTPILLKPVAGSLQIQGKSNATVVHLTSKPNGILAESDNGGTIRPAVSLRPLGTSRFLPLRNGDVVKSAAKIVGRESVESLRNSIVASERIRVSREALLTGDGGSGRPVKRVGFCKTEVHFAAESGKVKIVETDCKPPPSNRFRRRKRGAGLGVQGISATSAGRNLPVVHFGDTSYEKLILGVSNDGGDFDETKAGEKCTERSEADYNSMQETKKSGELVAEESIARNGWAARLNTILQSDEAPMPIDVRNDDLDEDLDAKQLSRSVKNNFELGGANVEETIAVGHTFKGHTTTVNLGADVMSKLQKRTNEGKCDTISTGIQLQFNTRLHKLRPAGVIDAVIKSPARVLVSPSVSDFGSLPASRIPRALTQAQQSSALKSTHLVMSLNRLNNSFVSIVSSRSDAGRDEDVDRQDTFGTILSSRKDAIDSPVNRSREDLANNNQLSFSAIASIGNKEAKPKANNFDPGARFAPLRSRLLGEDRRGSRKTAKVEAASYDLGEGQLQYSSGSEQADEEVRSYMLGSDTQPRIPLLLHSLKFQHSVKTHSHSQHRHRSSRKTLHETQEHHLAPPSALAMKKSTDSPDRLIIGNILEDELDIIGGSSGLPDDEICFEANGTMEKCYQQQQQQQRIQSEKTILQSEGKVVTSDNENNKVLMNIVETHEPAVTTRVQEDGSRKGSVNVRDLFMGKQPSPRPKLKSNDKQVTVHAGSPPASVVTETVKPGVVEHKVKERYCDVNPSSSLRKAAAVTSDAGYVTNVFERSCRGSERSAPIYENCRPSRRRDSGDRKSPKVVPGTSVNKVVKARSTSPSKTSGLFGEDSKPSEPDLEKEQEALRGSKTRNKRIVAAPSSTSSVNSVHRGSGGETQTRHRDPEAQARFLHNRSTRSSRLHRATLAGGRDQKMSLGRERENGERYATNNSNKKVVEEADNDDAIERLTNPVKGAKDSNDSVGGSRSKKPIEIVYQTAVFNMKNEKLAKASRSKESKTPRYINDLICGGRPKRTSGDARHVKGAAPSQQRSHRKSASPTNRHWK